MEQQNQFKKEQKIVDEFFKGLPEESFPIIIRKLIIKQGELEEKINILKELPVVKNQLLEYSYYWK